MARSRVPTVAPGEFRLPPPPERSGLVVRGAYELGLLPGHGGLLRVGLALAAFTWLPLALLTALEGGSDGVVVGFEDSFGTHARLLLGIPMFFFAEGLLGGRIAGVLHELQRTGIVSSNDDPRFIRAWDQTQRLWHSWAVEIALIAVAAATIYSGLRSDLPASLTTWRTAADGSLTWAGWWYTVVCLPVFRFLIGRWTWRLTVWVVLLWRLSRMHLNLMPTHPDNAGGLGGLGVAHVDLAPVIFAFSAMIAATFAEQIKFGVASFESFALPATALVAGLTAAGVLPLCLFSRRLLEVKQRGLVDYGSLATGYVRAFDDKWRRGGAGDEPLLGSADIQSLADLGNSFANIRSMQFVPISLSQITALAAAAALPILPLILFAVPLDQLVVGWFRSLVGM
jgi:hypothetical protein